MQRTRSIRWEVLPGGQATGLKFRSQGWSSAESQKGRRQGEQGASKKPTIRKSSPPEGGKMELCSMA